MGGGCCDFCCIGDCCVFDFCSDCGDRSCGDCSHVSSSKSIGNSSVNNHSKVIAEELEKTKNKYGNIAEKAEYQIIHEINSSMDDFIMAIQAINHRQYAGRTLSINVEYIKKKRDDLSNQVVGYIKDKLYDRLVLTDVELKVILEERDDTERDKNFQSFCDNVLNKAKKDLQEVIKNTINEQQKIVHHEIETRLQEIDNSMKTSLAAYEEIEKLGNKEIAEQEAAQLEYMYQLDLYNILADSLSMEDAATTSSRIKKKG